MNAVDVCKCRLAEATDALSSVQVSDTSRATLQLGHSTHGHARASRVREHSTER